MPQGLLRCAGLCPPWPLESYSSCTLCTSHVQPPGGSGQFISQSYSPLRQGTYLQCHATPHHTTSSAMLCDMLMQASAAASVLLQPCVTSCCHRHCRSHLRTPRVSSVSLAGAALHAALHEAHLTSLPGPWTPRARGQPAGAQLPCCQVLQPCSERLALGWPVAPAWLAAPQLLWAVQPGPGVFGELCLQGAHLC